MKNIFNKAKAAIMGLFGRNRKPEHKKILSSEKKVSNTNQRRNTLKPCYSPLHIIRRQHERREFRQRQLRDHFKLTGFETIEGDTIYALNWKNAQRKAKRLQTLIKPNDANPDCPDYLFALHHYPN